MSNLYRYILIVFMIQTALYSSESSKIGDILQVLIPSAAYGTTIYLDDEEGEYQFYKSFFTTVGVTYTLKYSLNTEKPNGEEHSFPSGHASLTFQGASFIHKRYGLKYAVIAYLGAVYTGYSRVQNDEHYVGDVIAGAIIGIASSFYFSAKYKDFKIKPMLSDASYGVIVTKKW